MTDESLMPFGKYRGKQLSEVPASYFHYLWFNGVKENKSHVLHDYIKENKTAFEAEQFDLIWE